MLYNNFRYRNPGHCTWDHLFPKNKLLKSDSNKEKYLLHWLNLGISKFFPNLFFPCLKDLLITDKLADLLFNQNHEANDLIGFLLRPFSSSCKTAAISDRPFHYRTILESDVTAFTSTGH